MTAPNSKPKNNNGDDGTNESENQNTSAHRHLGLRKIDPNVRHNNNSNLTEENSEKSKKRRGGGDVAVTSSIDNSKGIHKRSSNKKGSGGILKSKQKWGKCDHTPWMRLQSKLKRSSPNLVMKKSFSGSNKKGFIDRNDHDPIAAIIGAQNTSKVRFDLTQNIFHAPPVTAPPSLASEPMTLSSTLAQLSFVDDSSSTNDNNNKWDTSSSQQNKGFMRRIIFGSSSGNGNDLNSSQPRLPLPPSSSPTALRTKTKHSPSGGPSKAEVGTTATTATECIPFDEDPAVASNINELIRKGKKAQYVNYQYPKASKYYLEAISELDENSYPEYHKLRSITLHLLNDTYHALRTLEHSADIVKMGLKHEEKGELLKALKMYTVAFRMRRDAMGKNHPSLPVLLNMLGAVQIKRGDLNEAMQIFELALYGRLKSDTMTIVGKTNASHGTMAVSMREMGTIHEMLGEDNDAMEMYHESLECVLRRKLEEEEEKSKSSFHADSSATSYSTKKGESSQCEVCLISAASEDSGDDQNGASSKQLNESKDEEMEVYLEDKSFLGERNASNLGAFYNSFFQDKKAILSKNISVHVAMTLHNIANIHRKRRHYALALSTYEAALRGMKVALGKKHPNVAAVLGNIGNLHKDMKNFDLAFKIYQDVLKIESLNLGFGHPEVLVTMHNIAMIEKCRGNFKESKSLYREVLSIQHTLNERSVKAAVTFSCLGDVEEKDGNFKAAIAAYKQALSIRTQYSDKLNPDLGKILHKIGVLNGRCGNLRDASIYFAKALRLYEFNNIKDARLVEVQRDRADVLGKIALNMTFPSSVAVE